MGIVIKTLFQNLKERWKAETPKAFKTLRNITGTLAAMCAGAQTAISAVGIYADPFWTKLFAYVIGISAALAIYAQLKHIDDNGKQ